MMAAAQEVLFFAILILSPLAYGSVEVWSSAALHCAVLVLILLWAGEGIVSGGLSLRKTPVNAPLLAFLFYSAVNVGLSRYRAASRDQFFVIMDCVVMFFLGLRILSRRGVLVRSTYMMTALGVGLSLYGIIGYFSHQEPLGLRGPFVNHNHFAGWLEMCFPLPLALAVFGAGHRRKLRPVFFFSSLVIGFALLFTLSRGGVVSMSLALIGALFLLISEGMVSRRTLGAFFFPLVLLLYAYLSGMDPLLRRFSPGNIEISGTARFSLWGAAIRAFRERPLVGSGLGTFSWLYPRYRPPAVVNKVDHAHNEYLQILAEMGSVGFILTAICLGAFIRAFVKGLWSRKDPETKGLALGAFTGVVSLALHNVVDFNLHLPSNAVLWCVEAGLALVAVNTRIRNGHECLLPEGLIPLRGAVRVVGAALVIPLSVLWAWILIRPALAHAHYSRESLDGLQRAVDLDGGRAEYHCALGRAYYRLPVQSSASTATQPSPAMERDDLLRKAAGEMETGLRLNARDSDCHCDLGWTLLTLGLPDRAEKEIRTCVDLDPNNFSYRQILADYYLRVGRKDLAIEEERRAASIYPLGLWGFLEEAASAGVTPDDLFRIVPEKPESLRQFALFLASRGRKAEAVGALEKAFALSPRDVHTIKALTEAYKENGRDNDALSLIRSALKEDSRSEELHRILGDLYTRAGQEERAVDEYRKAMAADPSDLSAYSGLSGLYRKMGGREKAEAVLKEGVERNPGNGAFVLELARFYRDEGKWLEALQTAKRGAAGDARGDIRGFLATLYLDKKMYFEAIVELKEILKVHPANMGVRFRIGEIYEGLNLYSQARRTYEDILSINPADRQAKDRLAKLPKP